jgi:nucleoid-associated protein YgaU
MGGCATTQEPAPAPAESSGPTAAEIEAQRRAEAEAARRANEAALAEARQVLGQIREHTNTNADQRSRVQQIEQAISNGDGSRAAGLANALLSELRAASMTYTVVTGDSLWRISGRAEVYGNPYQWPLIYKANADQIRDADLIHPGQMFEVTKHPLQGDVDSAVNHARNRGAWSIGETEDSDRRYLGR